MTGKNKIVSVIVPVYNTEKYLPSCIESIRNQTYTSLQIILVDDESSDKCPEICDRYAEIDARITVIHQKNTGVSGARNAGLSRVTGEYIAFVDSDDELYPDAIEIMLSDVSEYDADIVSATKRVVDQNNVTIKEYEDGATICYSDNEALLLSLRGDPNTNSACAKLFKTAFVEGFFYEQGQNINEDGYFIFKCYLKKPLLVQHNVSVYKYNSLDDSNSKQTFSEKYLSMIYYADCKKKIIETQYPEYIKEANNMEVRTHLQFLDVLCRTNDKQYKNLHKDSVRIVRELYKYHKPINDHHKKLAWIVAHGLYPLYKKAIRFKYYR